MAVTGSARKKARSGELVLNVLEQAPVAAGSSGAKALRNAIELARVAERLGYRRFWVAEHHGRKMVAGASPEILVGSVAGATSRIRVGSGGVMLPNYSSFKVAENFSTLAGLHPGRIDLGLGRASGTDRITTLALQRDRERYPPDDFPEQLSELLGYLEGDLPGGHPFRSLTEVLPGRPETAEPWLLGSSFQSAVWAAELGLPYAFADFLNPRGPEIARAYQKRFDPGKRLEGSRTAVAVWALAADSEREARYIHSSTIMAVATAYSTGQMVELPPPEAAAKFVERERPILPNHRVVLGTGDMVREGLEAVAQEYGAQEVFLVTWAYDFEARVRSHELIAEAFQLKTVA